MHQMRINSDFTFFLSSFFLGLNSPVNHQVHMHDDLKKRFISGARERKELYNKVLELKG